MAKKDDELIVIGRLWRTLDGMTTDARSRAMDYLSSRHEEKMTAETLGERAGDEPVEFPIQG